MALVIDSQNLTRMESVCLRTRQRSKTGVRSSRSARFLPYSKRGGNASRPTKHTTSCRPPDIQSGSKGEISLAQKVVFRPCPSRRALS